jgi:hypothetical protein
MMDRMKKGVNVGTGSNVLEEGVMYYRSPMGQKKQVELEYNKGCLGELKPHLMEKWRQFWTLWIMSIIT